MLKAGADPNIKNYNGQNAFDLAHVSEDSNVAKVMEQYCKENNINMCDFKKPGGDDEDVDML